MGRYIPQPTALLKTPNANGRYTSPITGYSNQPAQFGHYVSTLTGSVTADTYKSMVSVTGPGVLNIAAVRPTDTTSRTISLRLTLDGATYYEGSGATTVATAMLVGAGYFLPGTTTFFVGEAIPFNQSLTIEIKSSLTETDKQFFYYQYSRCP